MILRTALYAYAEALGGRWLPGACVGCGKRIRVQYQAFSIEPWDRIVIHPYRCRRCCRRRGTAEDRDHHRWLRALRSDRTLRLWLGRRR